MDMAASGDERTPESPNAAKARAWWNAHWTDNPENVATTYASLARLLAQVAAEEREACAALAEGDASLHLYPGSARNQVAAAIRARGKA
jgi:hypothetical protein